MLQDKYRRLIEIGQVLKDRDGMEYKVVSMMTDEREMLLHEVREDGEIRAYNCTEKAARNLWIVGSQAAHSK
jgi:hypothetical protein